MTTTKAERAKDESKPAALNPPRVARDQYPRWIVASVPGAGEVALVVNSEAQEADVNAGRASFKVTKSAHGDSYEIV